MDIKHIIAYNIKLQRGIKNLTQEELSKAVGVPNSTLSNIETAKLQPNDDLLNKIASVLGIDTTLLFTPVSNEFGHSKVESTLEESRKNQVIANNIKRLRKEKGLKQQEFSKMIGVTGGMLSLIETNKRYPNDELITKIANALRVDKESLLQEPQPDKKGERDDQGDQNMIMDVVKRMGPTYAALENAKLAIENKEGVYEALLEITKTLEEMLPQIEKMESLTMQNEYLERLLERIAKTK